MFLPPHVLPSVPAWGLPWDIVLQGQHSHWSLMFCSSFKINLLHCVLSTDVSVDICSAMVSPQAVGGTLLHYGVPLPPCSPLTLVSTGLFLNFSLPSFLKLMCSIFYPFLNLSPSGATILAAGPSHVLWQGHGSQLELSASSMGQAQPHLPEEPCMLPQLPTPCHVDPNTLRSLSQ